MYLVTKNFQGLFRIFYTDRDHGFASFGSSRPPLSWRVFKSGNCWSVIRRVRLISGLILFSYVTMHLVAPALGNVSLALMEQVRPFMQAPWETLPGQGLLYASMSAHLALAFYALYRRRRWRNMRAGEVFQLAFGFAIPPLLVLHLVSTRVASDVFALDPTYPWIMAIFFEFDTLSGLRQLGVLLAAWVHGCLGIYFWLRLKPWWGRVRQPLFAAALVWPTVALLGFYSAGQEAAALTKNPDWIKKTLQQVGSLGPDLVEMLKLTEFWISITMLFFLVVIPPLRFLRHRMERRRGLVHIRYDNGKEAVINQGVSILEASREKGIPHASVCGGRGRCSTCRVRVRAGGKFLPQPSEAEVKVLRRIRAASDVRLACQCIPACGVVEVTPLLPPSATAKDGHDRPEYLQGREMEIAVLFADLRGFTQLSEDRLPYDTVFLLNRYFDSMGRAIEEAGGHLDKFIGDGIMALFGVDNDPADGCRKALRAAELMSERLASLNQGLKNDLRQPLRIGIGIHAGAAIVGEMGYGRATQLTAIGDTVNTASRLESKTKDYGAQLIVSGSVLGVANVMPPDRLPADEITVRGRNEPLAVHVVMDASVLSEIIPELTDDL